MNRKSLQHSTTDIDQLIVVVRGQKVILDSDLATVYGVSTKRLNEQVKRNEDRFPADFAFQLSLAEKAEVVANCDHLARLKFSPVLPRAFTEHGAIMAANVSHRGYAAIPEILAWAAEPRSAGFRLRAPQLRALEM
jgi:hypothetical protein